VSGQKIKRGGKSVRKAAAAQNKSRQVRAAKARTGSVVDTVMAIQPFNESQLHRIFLAVILGATAVLIWMVASFAGLPAMAREQLAHLSHQAGFELRNVEVRGTNHLNELKVYQIALADRDRAMPFVDLEATRDRLMQLSWVEDARVSRQLPDTLVIDIVERKPVAVLAKADKLVLIDPTGRELERISPERAKGKLVLSGPGAGQQIGALTALLDAVMEARGSSGPPVFLKVAPDLESADVEAIARIAIDKKLGALIVSNTTISRPPLQSRHALEAGGLSGAPLRELALERLRQFRRATGGAMPLIGVGGIATAEHAWQRIRAGASLVQLYSAMAYEGPGIAREIVRGLERLMQRDGFGSIAEAVGSE